MSFRNCRSRCRCRASSVREAENGGLEFAFRMNFACHKDVIIRVVVHTSNGCESQRARGSTGTARTWHSHSQKQDARKQTFLQLGFAPELCVSMPACWFMRNLKIRRANSPVPPTLQDCQRVLKMSTSVIVTVNVALQC